MLIFLLAACGNVAQSPNNETPASKKDAAEAELVIKASNYQFDQQAYHVKKGVPVQITLENVDGNHGVNIDRLDVHLDRKHSSAVVTPTETGQYDIACSIPCGPGHKMMKAVLYVE
ncbi:cupredoxin domain-containing protein [Paenibacillus sp. CAA11]|uniref:cupredoxin domain-containing protein n=1 Tax=Paenibacillus sp. CAA11 TaxID=1532905 RepID=UPI001F397F70|nr:cupredoxin domain-containing protein [Paenibacillus sp. CAA11]